MRVHLVGVMAVAGLLAAPVAAAAQEPGPTITTQVVTSHDGTPIVSTLFLPPGASAEHPVPLVLRTHGWAGTGETTVGGTLDVMLEQGYAVLTWDQRGFGCSGGVVQIDKPDVEGRDASALIDWAVANAPIATVDGDPLVGFTGGSYAGGIQTATASLDPRIDAIAPEISWADLRYSLYSGQVLNQGWAATLYAAGVPTATAPGLAPSCPGFAEHGPQDGGLHPMITQGFVEAVSTGTVSEEVLDFFAASSLAAYGQDDPVAVPTLVLQGSVDTLFDLSDGHRVYEHVRNQGAPARFVAFCGGHVACPASYAAMDDRAHMDDAIVTWFARYLEGDTSVDTGPPVEYRTNAGEWRGADAFPPSGFGTLEAAGTGSLVSIPALDTPAPQELVGYVEGLQGGGIPALPLTAAQPANEAELAAGQAFSVPVGAADDGPLELLGIPEVEVTVSGSGPEVVLFARLVDREAGEVVNLQEGAVRVPLGGGEATVAVPMSGMAYTLPDGHHLDLEVSTASTMHGNARTPAEVEVEVAASVPASVAPATASAPPPATPQDVPDPAPATTPPGEVTAAPAPLPATGGAVPPALPVGLLVLALSARSWRSARPRS